MDDLIIRFGSWEGARNPSRGDIDKTLSDIESGECQRPEFTIERVSNWKPETVDGQRVIRDVKEPPIAFAATVYREGIKGAVGWYVTILLGAKSQFAVVSGDSPDFFEGICCGGPLEIRSSCVVPKGVALEALSHFAEHRQMSPSQRWIPESESYNV